MNSQFGIRPASPVTFVKGVPARIIARSDSSTKQFSAVFAITHHVVRADAVVVERQGMQQHTAAFTAECIRHLRDDSLRRGASSPPNMMTTSPCVSVDCFACGFDLGGIDIHLARRQQRHRRRSPAPARRRLRLPGRM